MERGYGEPERERTMQIGDKDLTGSFTF